MDPGWGWGGPRETLQEKVTLVLIHKGENPRSTLRAACLNVQTLTAANMFQEGQNKEAIGLGGINPGGLPRGGTVIGWEENCSRR